MNQVMTVDLEEGLPSVAEAMEHLKWSVSTRKKDGRAICLFIIHGYGKHGKAYGAIIQAARKWLSAQLQKQTIKSVIFGENFNPCNSELTYLTDKYRELKPLTRNTNPGVTVVSF